MIALEKKPKATKFIDRSTISPMAHTTKIVAWVLRRRFERKIEDILGEDQFGYRRERRTRDTTGMLRIIAKQILDINEELCACFIDWQKAQDSVNWTKLIQILKGTCIVWRERRLISKLYINQIVKLRMDQAETRSLKIARGFRK